MNRIVYVYMHGVHTKVSHQINYIFIEIYVKRKHGTLDEFKNIHPFTKIITDINVRSAYFLIPVGLILTR